MHKTSYKERQKAAGRPDLCCRGFKIKLGVLMSHLKNGNVFGPYDLYLSAVEYQKRGLPHAHVIIKLRNTGPHVLDQMYSRVWAQWPNASIANGNLREMGPQMYDTQAVWLSQR